MTTLTLNLCEKGDALLNEIDAAVDALAVIFLRSNGSIFCAGNDSKERPPQSVELLSGKDRHATGWDWGYAHGRPNLLGGKQAAIPQVPASIEQRTALRVVDQLSGHRSTQIVAVFDFS